MMAKPINNQINIDNTKYKIAIILITLVFFRVP